VNNLNQIRKLYNGPAQKSLSKQKLNSVKIPIPSLDQQKSIVEYLDFINKAGDLSKEKITSLQKLNEYRVKFLTVDQDTKTLGEITTINPENMKSGQYSEINYIDITSVKRGQILELQKITSDFPSRAKRIVKKYDVLYSSVRPNLKGYVYIDDDIQNGIASTGFAVIRVTDTNIILPKYLYYIMTSDYISTELISKAKGAQYPAVSFDDFGNIKIPVLPLDQQKTIVDYCEANDRLIKQLENEITANKKRAKEFLNAALAVEPAPDQLQERPDNLSEPSEHSEPDQ
jgi:restriction endonuclease S subunit